MMTMLPGIYARQCRASSTLRMTRCNNSRSFGANFAMFPMCAMCAMKAAFEMIAAGVDHTLNRALEQCATSEVLSEAGLINASLLRVC